MSDEPCGTKAKNATAYGNAFETNILLASPPEAKINVKFFFIYDRLANIKNIKSFLTELIQ
ncbi:hypothetical protein GCM10011384_44690 [Psychrobacillus lasiicapitis]|nr:hypothetical protein GCM10011384_44690 [Psychrobacillus lasiicapitis]